MKLLPFIPLPMLIRNSKLNVPFFNALAWIALPLLACSQNPPAQPVNAGPAHNSTLLSTNANLSAAVSHPQASPLSVAFFVRPCPPAPGPDFTVVGIPDTQYYTAQINGGSNAIYKAQVNWILNNRIAENIVFVEGLGDCVQNGNSAVNEWKRVDTCMKIIENPVTTTLTHGIPYGLNVGNHDQTPEGTPGGTTLFNQYFGTSRFAGRNYYGGNFGSNNNNNYQLFSASGLDFIVINLEYSTILPTALVNWIQGLLTTYSNRRAIIGSHYIINAAGNFGFQGEAIYNAVKNYPNVFLMMCGHISDEAMRTDILNGKTITTLLSNYQNRSNGGNGWMRLMKFSPANNTISVRTYSPWLNQYETDFNSQFTISYNMQPPFTQIGSLPSVNSGHTAVLPVNNLLPNTCYQWYASVSDGSSVVNGPMWTFTTGQNATPVSINLKVYFEGYYNGNGLMSSVSNPAVCDTAFIDLHHVYAPYSLYQSVKSTISTSGNGSFAFPSTAYGNSYYLTVRHRTSLQTWSAMPVMLNASNISYDFTDAKHKAYGNNLSDLKDGRWAVFSGDLDQSGAVNLWDYLLTQSNTRFFFTGYSSYDITGDKVVDAADFSMVENNMQNGIVVSKP